MPPKRGASKTRAVKEQEASVQGDKEQKTDKRTRLAKTSIKITAASPPKVDDNKQKSRGRSKKAEQVVEQEQAAEIVPETKTKSRGRPKKTEQLVPAPTTESLPENAVGKRARAVKEVPKPVEKPTRGRSRAPVASKEDEKASPRSRSGSKIDDKSRSPSKTAKVSSPKKTPEKKASRAKSPAKKAAKTKSPAKKAAKTPQKTEKTETKNVPVAKAPAKSKSRGKLDEEVVPEDEPKIEIPPVDVPIKGRRGRPVGKKANVEAVPDAPKEEAPPVEVVKAKSRGRPKKATVEPEVEGTKDVVLPVENEQAAAATIAADSVPVEPPTDKPTEPLQADPTPVVDLPETGLPTVERGRRKAPLARETKVEIVSKGRKRRKVETQESEIPKSQEDALPEISAEKKVLKEPLITTVDSKPVAVSTEKTVQTQVDPSPVVPSVIPSSADQNDETMILDNSSDQLNMMPVLRDVQQEKMEEEDEERKRKLSVDDVREEEAPSKRAKIQKLPVVRCPETCGQLMGCGADTTGELGMRVIGMEKRRPVPISSITQPICMVATGAMHTVAVSAKGKKVFTFGCNDELALGRKTAAVAANGDDDIATNGSDESPEAIPMPVPLNHQIVRVTAGDSHTVALNEFGHLSIWGVFRDNRGKIGLLPDNVPKKPIGYPTPIMTDLGITVVDMASGDNHVIILDDEGFVYSFGVGEQGQLGRIPESESSIEEDGSNLKRFLTPEKVDIGSNGNERCDRVWATAFTSFVRTTEGKIYAWGLNNYCQLGFKSKEGVIVEPFPKELPPFCDSVESVAGGQHHTLVLDSTGKVYSFGKHLYGLLGHPDLTADVETPKQIEALKDEKVIQIACGIASSFAVTESGNLYSWGQYSVHLGHVQSKEEEEEDVIIPRKVTGNKLANTSFYAVASGTQHAVFIASGGLEPQNGN